MDILAVHVWAIQQKLVLRDTDDEVQPMRTLKMPLDGQLLVAHNVT